MLTLATYAFLLEWFNSPRGFVVGGESGSELESLSATITVWTELIAFLADHAGSGKLVFCNFLIGRDGYAASADLLQKLRSNLTKLELMNTGIENEGALILSVGLNGHKMLRELNLSWNPNIAEPG
jgi:hypothetical protein